MNCPICGKEGHVIPVPNSTTRLQLLCNCGQKNDKFRGVVEFDTMMLQEFQKARVAAAITPQKAAWAKRKQAV